MLTNKVISAIYNYKEDCGKNDERKDFFIPCVFENEQPIFACFINLFTENKYFRTFVNQWASSLGYSWNDILDSFYSEKEKYQLIMSLLQGIFETIKYPEKIPQKEIEKENNRFAGKVLSMINTGEKILWNLLKREKFLLSRGRFISFDDLVLQLQKQEPRLIFNKIALYIQLEVIVEKFGTNQLKAEFREIMKELKIWIKSNLS